MDFFVSETDPLMNKQNVALFCMLRSKSTGILYLITNCHILFNKSRGDIKFAQVVTIMRGISLILSTYRRPLLIQSMKMYMLYGLAILIPCRDRPCTSSSKLDRLRTSKDSRLAHGRASTPLLVCI